MIRFEYLEPKTLKKTLTLLNQHKGRAKILAGGTDLLRQCMQRSVQPHYLINIKRLLKIVSISTSSNATLNIGAACTAGSIEFSALVKKNPLDCLNRLMPLVRPSHDGGNMMI